MATIAFDVYGTLIDTHAVVSKLQAWLGSDAPAFSQCWRDKQLEYSFRRGLMQNYVPFSVCTRQALDYACMSKSVSLSDAQKQALLAMYQVLPAFDDVKPALETFQQKGIRVVAFSNGEANPVENLLQQAGIDTLFSDVISCEAIQTYKPNPAVYSYLVRRTASVGKEVWLVSSNPFDVTGAISSGLQAAWVQRFENQPFDPWETEPSLVVNNLEQLSALDVF